LVLTDKRKSPGMKNIKWDHQPLASPENLTATAGDLDGEIDLIWEPVEKANSYIIQCSRSDKGPGEWIQEDVVSKSSHTVSRLKSGRNYWFRVAAAGSKGQGLWCKPVNKKVP
jgi:hypothetical protein